MKCPKCEAEIASESAMCPRCGAFTGRSEQQSAQPAARSKPKPLWIAAAALAVIIIIALMILLRLQGQPITQAQGPTAAPPAAITNATVAPPTGPNITAAPPPAPAPAAPAPAAVKKPVPPQEVVDYLNFVKDIEQQRQALLKDTARAVTMAAGQSQAQSMLDAIAIAMDDTGTATTPKAANNVQTELDTHITNWRNLLGRFDSKPAPAQCADFAANYRQVIGNEAAGMTKVIAIFKSVDWSSVDSIKNTINQLQQLKADPNLQGSIDKAVEASDSRLTTLCSYYDMAKPFDVKKEEASASIIAPGM